MIKVANEGILKYNKLNKLRRVRMLSKKDYKKLHYLIQFAFIAVFLFLGYLAVSDIHELLFHIAGNFGRQECKADAVLQNFFAVFLNDLENDQTGILIFLFTFGFGGGDEDDANQHFPGTWTENYVAYTGTHDGSDSGAHGCSDSGSCRRRRLRSWLRS